MGWERLTGNLSAAVSRHNSPRDARDDALWNELTVRIRELVEDPKYADIMPLWDAPEAGE
jgi:hypothetical protein